MKSKILDILYNSGSINTCSENFEPESFIDPSQQLDFHDADTKMLHKFEAMLLSKQENKLLNKSKEFYEQFKLGINTGLRQVLLKEFNRLLEKTSKSHALSQPIFNQFLKIIIEFKNQVESHNSTQGAINKEEWVGLEHSLFLLTKWETQLGINTEEMILFEDEA
ncbi:hypothetical protein BVY03_06150 [bacterium K02(2017)]|nr:hypothetical protein BVY03_06150 [bacterium K02(2017)]